MLNKLNRNTSIIIVNLIFIFSPYYSFSIGKAENNHFYSKLKEVPDNVWEKLSHKTIYFAHQSVGYNIIDGIEYLIKEYPKIKLRVVESRDSASLSPGTLVHSQIGKNFDPQSKLDDFYSVIVNGFGGKVDIAGLKFCYIDISSKTKPEALFSQYKSQIDTIRKLYPKIAIIHFTSPLTTLQSGPKAWIKKLIGRPITGLEENIKRNEYNELLRAEYEDKDPILDIAAIESTYPNGTRYTFVSNGKIYYSLVPDYTSDGGHLNELGRKKIAEKYLLILANLD